MLIIHDLDRFQVTWDSCVLTLGVFDGLHRGHQKILKQLQKRSHKKKHARILLTYDPHPDFVLGKRKPESNSELFSYPEKLSLFQNFDLDAVCFLHFTPQVARMTAARYLKEILLAKLRSAHIIIGYDQRFGRGRKGSYAFLKKMRHRYGFKVEQIGAVKYRGEIISTTTIRNHILNGKIEQANLLLGYDFFIQTMVKRGLQRGQKLGFPTANLDIALTKTIPKRGVYIGFARWGGKSYRAMINVGNSPTFNDQVQVTVETHLIGFAGQLYGQTLQLCFKKRIRDQLRFASARELSAQLERDQALAVAYKF